MKPLAFALVLLVPSIAAAKTAKIDMDYPPKQNMQLTFFPDQVPSRSVGSLPVAGQFSGRVRLFVFGRVGGAVRLRFYSGGAVVSQSTFTLMSPSQVVNLNFVGNANGFIVGRVDCSDEFVGAVLQEGSVTY